MRVFWQFFVFYIVLIGEPKHLQLVICPLKYIAEFQEYLFIPPSNISSYGGFHFKQVQQYDKQWESGILITVLLSPAWLSSVTDPFFSSMHGNYEIEQHLVWK
jgi:hypothetical protein